MVQERPTEHICGDEQQNGNLTEENFFAKALEQIKKTLKSSFLQIIHRKRAGRCKLFIPLFLISNCVISMLVVFETFMVEFFFFVKTRIVYVPEQISKQIWKSSHSFKFYIENHSLYTILKSQFYYLVLLV